MLTAVLCASGDASDELGVSGCFVTINSLRYIHSWAPLTREYGPANDSCVCVWRIVSAHRVCASCLAQSCLTHHVWRNRVWRIVSGASCLVW